MALVLERQQRRRRRYELESLGVAGSHLAMFRTATEILDDLFALCRRMWHELDAHGFTVVGGVAITALEQLPARVRADYMLAPIYASGVALERAR